MIVCCKQRLNHNSLQEQFSSLLIGYKLVKNKEYTAYTLNTSIVTGNDNPEEFTLPCLKKAIEFAFATMEERSHLYLKMLLGWDDNVPKNLAEIGRQEGLSRERVRQIVKRGKDYIFKLTDLSGFTKPWICSIFSERTKPILMSDLSQEIPEFAGFERSPQTLVNVLKRLFKIKIYYVRMRNYDYISSIPQAKYEANKSKIIRKIAYEYDGEKSTFFMKEKIRDYLNGNGLGYLIDEVIHDYVDLRVLSTTIAKIAFKFADEIISENLWSIKLTTLHEKLFLDNLINDKYDGETSITAIVEASLLLEKEVRIKDYNLFSVHLYNIRFGNMLEVLESVLLVMKGPKHHKDISDEVLKWRPTFSRQTLYISLNTRVDNAMLWGRGVYVHRDNINIPLSLIKDIEAWLVSALSNNVPFVMIGGAYRKFKYRCSQAGIVSESALYSCLKISATCELVFPWTPLVFASRNYDEEVNMVVGFEEYLLDEGGPVSREEIDSYWKSMMFLTVRQIDNLTERTPNIIKADNSEFIHVRNLEYDQHIMKSIAEYVNKKIGEEGHYSVSKIYKEKQITCRMAGIYGPAILYQLLEHTNSENCKYTHYPLIENTKDSPNRNGSSIVKKVVKFVSDQLKPCTYQKIYDEFASPHGYSSDIVYNVATQESIVRYHRGSIVHLASLEWDSEKQVKLEDLASSVYNSAYESGRIFARVSDLLESGNLPFLPRGILWSKVLLGELLRNGAKVHLIGNTQEAYVLKGNSLGIHNLETLIAEMLRRSWGGAVKHSIFEKELVKTGIVRRSLSQNMISPSKVIIIKNGVVMLKELS